MCGENDIDFAVADANSPSLVDTVSKQFDHPDLILSVLMIQELADLEILLSSLRQICSPKSKLLCVTVHPDFGERLLVSDGSENQTFIPAEIEDVSWDWAADYPIADDPHEPFPLPYFHRTIETYTKVFASHDFKLSDSLPFPDPQEEIPDLTEHGIAPFAPSDGNVYWPLIAEMPSSLVFTASPVKRITKSRSALAIPNEMTGGKSYESLREQFINLLIDSKQSFETKSYSAPELYSLDRVSYIIPPITAVEDRAGWRPSSVFVVKSGTVAIGRVSYTKTSGEYLTEELILGRGDIFGEFEVPLTILGSNISPGGIFPPRVNMTYGAWASGPALNWAMSYPRFIPRDSIAPDNAKSAVHPFYIKSKNIRPSSDAEIIIVPIARFEEVLSSNAEVMTWFLMNVLRKTRLYFEPPTPGYGRSAENTISRLVIRLMAHRLRLGVAVSGKEGDKTFCRTFIGPTEWLKFGLGPYMSDIKEIIQSSGGKPKETHELPIFSDELENIMKVIYHYPLKNLDDDMLTAMGCSPSEDRKENRYGLLTGFFIEANDLDFFSDYLLKNGE